MVRPTYAVAVDLDGNELFTDTDEDVTAVVLPPMRMTRGKNLVRSLAPPMAGASRLEIRNTSLDYGPSSNLKRGKQMRIRATESGTTYDIARGILKRPVQHPETRVQRVTVDALGTLSRLIGKEKLSTALFSSIKTDVALGHVLDAVGWPKNHQPYVTDLAPAGQWGLGGASGVAVDSSGNGNDGTVTIGAGSRDFAALDDGGDGCIDFDGADTRVTVAPDAAISDIYDGGGSFAMILNLDSVGEGSAGRLIQKDRWWFRTVSESGGACKINWFYQWTGGTAEWQTTDRPLILGRTYLWVFSFNADAAANNPTMYLYDFTTETIETLTVGGGITEYTAPSGTRLSDSSGTFVIGNDTASSATTDGRIDEVELFSTQLTLAQVQAMAARAKDAPRTLDTGLTTFGQWWLDGEDAWNAVQKILTSEGPGSRLYEKGNGSIVFKNRHAAMLEARSTISRQLFGGAGISMVGFAYEDGIGNVVNECKLKVKAYATQAVQVIWKLGSTVALGPNEVRKYIARGGLEQDATTGQFIGPFSGALTPVVSTDYTVTAGSLASVTIDRTSGACVEITLTAGTAGATVTGLQLRAAPVTETMTTQIINTIDASASIAQHGRQTYQLPIFPAIDVNTAQDFANAVVGWYQDGRPQVRFKVVANISAAALTQCLAREIADRITVTETGTGLVAAPFWIENERHTVTIGGALHETEFGGERVDAASYFINGVSALDDVDGLGF